MQVLIRANTFWAEVLIQVFEQCFNVNSRTLGITAAAADRSALITAMPEVQGWGSALIGSFRKLPISVLKLPSSNRLSFQGWY